MATANVPRALDGFSFELGPVDNSTNSAALSSVSKLITLDSKGSKISLCFREVDFFSVRFTFLLGHVHSSPITTKPQQSSRCKRAGTFDHCLMID